MCSIGKGAFGTVNLVRHTITQQLFAQKSMKKDQIASNDKQAELILNEKKVLMKLKNQPFSVHLVETLQDELNLYLLMEYLPGRELL